MDKEFYVSVELYVSAKAASALRKVCVRAPGSRLGGRDAEHRSFLLR